MAYENIKNKVTYIYALGDPDTGEIRYVGASTNPERRIVTHYACGSLEKKRYFDNLKKAEKRPVLHIVEKCHTSIRWEREGYWIQHYIKNGNRLLNDRNRY